MNDIDIEKYNSNIIQELNAAEEEGEYSLSIFLHDLIEIDIESNFTFNYKVINRVIDICINSLNNALILLAHDCMYFIRYCINKCINVEEEINNVFFQKLNIIIDICLKENIYIDNSFLLFERTFFFFILDLNNIINLIDKWKIYETELNFFFESLLQIISLQLLLVNQILNDIKTKENLNINDIQKGYSRIKIIEIAFDLLLLIFESIYDIQNINTFEECINNILKQYEHIPDIEIKKKILSLFKYIEKFTIEKKIHEFSFYKKIVNLLNKKKNYCLALTKEKNISINYLKSNFYIYVDKSSLSLKTFDGDGCEGTSGNESNAERSDDKGSDVKGSDDKRSDDKRSDDKRSDDEISDDKRSDDEISDDKRSDDEISNVEKSNNERSNDEESNAEKSNDERSNDEISNAEKSNDEESGCEKNRTNNKITLTSTNYEGCLLMNIFYFYFYDTKNKLLMVLSYDQAKIKDKDKMKTIYFQLKQDDAIGILSNELRKQYEDSFLSNIEISITFNTELIKKNIYDTIHNVIEIENSNVNDDNDDNKKKNENEEGNEKKEKKNDENDKYLKNNLYINELKNEIVAIPNNDINTNIYENHIMYISSKSKDKLERRKVSFATTKEICLLNDSTSVETKTMLLDESINTINGENNDFMNNQNNYESKEEENNENNIYMEFNENNHLNKNNTLIKENKIEEKGINVKVSYATTKDLISDNNTHNINFINNNNNIAYENSLNEELSVDLQNSSIIFNDNNDNVMNSNQTNLNSQTKQAKHTVVNLFMENESNVNNISGNGIGDINNSISNDNISNDNISNDNISNDNISNDNISNNNVSDNGTGIINNNNVSDIGTGNVSNSNVSNNHINGNMHLQKTICDKNDTLIKNNLNIQNGPNDNINKNENKRILTNDSIKENNKKKTFGNNNNNNDIEEMSLSNNSQKSNINNIGNISKSPVDIVRELLNYDEKQKNIDECIHSINKFNKKNISKIDNSNINSKNNKSIKHSIYNVFNNVNNKKIKNISQNIRSEEKNEQINTNNNKNEIKYNRKLNNDVNVIKEYSEVVNIVGKDESSNETVLNDVCENDNINNKVSNERNNGSNSRSNHRSNHGNNNENNIENSNGSNIGNSNVSNIENSNGSNVENSNGSNVEYSNGSNVENSNGSNKNNNLLMNKNKKRVNTNTFSNNSDSYSKNNIDSPYPIKKVKFNNYNSEFLDILKKEDNLENLSVKYLIKAYTLIQYNKRYIQIQIIDYFRYIRKEILLSYEKTNAKYSNLLKELQIKHEHKFQNILYKYSNCLTTKKKKKRINLNAPKTIDLNLIQKKIKSLYHTFDVVQRTMNDKISNSKILIKYKQSDIYTPSFSLGTIVSKYSSV